MEWTEWATYEPKTKSDIISKITNDGYTYPHYDKLKNGVRYVICTEAIKKDCQIAGIALNEVYPLQLKLF